MGRYITAMATGRILPGLEPDARYRPGQHKKRASFKFRLTRFKLRMNRRKNQNRYWPEIYDDSYRHKKGWPGYEFVFPTPNQDK